MRAPGAGGICTAVPWGDGHKKGYLNKITAKSRAPTKTADDAHEGPGTQWRRDRQAQAGRGYPWRLCGGRGRWALLSGYSNNTLLAGSTFSPPA